MAILVMRSTTLSIGPARSSGRRSAGGVGSCGHDKCVTTKYQIGEQVLVPASRLAEPDNQPFGLMPRQVLAQDARSVCVDDGAGGQVNVASRLVHSRTLGLLVLRVGDLTTETTLLDPLAKSVLQFVRLLLPDNDVRAVNIRTLEELHAHWSSYHGSTSHVVLVGHGSNTSLSFLAGAVPAKDLASGLLALAPQTPPKTWISLACLTGRAGFARPFSQSAICRDLVAPYTSVHGAAASQFCQSLLAEHLLDGYELPYAYRRAVKTASGGRSFRRWRDGKQIST